MEYGFIICQIILISLTSPRDMYLSSVQGYYKRCLYTEIIIQGLCIVVNVINLFVYKEIIPHVLFLDIILVGVIDIFYSQKAKQVYFKELTNLILENNLLSMDAREIKYYLLKEYGQVHYTEDIDICLSKINK